MLGPALAPCADNNMAAMTKDGLQFGQGKGVCLFGLFFFFFYNASELKFLCSKIMKKHPAKQPGPGREVGHWVEADSHTKARRAEPWEGQMGPRLAFSWQMVVFGQPFTASSFWACGRRR